MTSQNTVKTVVLLGALTGLLVAIGGLIGGQSGMMIAFGFAIMMNIGSWWFSDSIALKMNGAREVPESEVPSLHQLVEQLSINAGIPKPRVAIVDSPMPNAFATGRSPEKGVVAVTTGILGILSRDELAGVIAHELAHIKNRDTLISAVAATIAGAISTIANIAQWSLFFGYRGDDDDNPLGIVGVLLAIFVAPVAAVIIQMAISRSREFDADADGARIAGNPESLASALIKLENWSQNPQAQAIAHHDMREATAHQYIVNPLRGGFSSLFRTHPPTEERVEKLRSVRL
jgi:heat shock protein HtpX